MAKKRNAAKKKPGPAEPAPESTGRPSGVELGQLSADLQNLLSATDIATLFLDRELRIVRFTPPVAELFNIRHTDRGRPLSDLTHHLGHGQFTEDAERVLDRLIPVEREIQSENGRCYLTRILPYRSVEDRIEGVVITFVDITYRKQIEDEVAAAREYAESIIATLHEPLLVLHPDLTVRSVNQAFYAQFQVRLEETIGRRIYDLGNGQWNIPELRTLLEDVLPESNVFNDYEVRHHFEDIGERVMLLNARRLDHVQLILLGIRDITEKQRAVEAMRKSAQRYRELVFQIREYAIFRIDPQGRPVTWNEGVQRVLGFSESEFIGADIASMIFTPEAIAAGLPQRELEEAARTGTASNDRWMRRKDGERFYALGMTNVLHDEQGDVVGFTKVMRDHTDLRRVEDALRQSEQRMQRITNVEGVGVMTFASEGTLLDANDAFFQMTGYSREQVQSGSLHWRDMTPPEYIAESEAQLQRLAETGRIDPYEKEYFLADGSRSWMLFAGADLGDGTYIKYMIDVSDRKKAEDALSQSEQELRRARDELEQRVAERTVELQVQAERMQRLARKLSHAEHEERKRLADYLHEDMQQLLVAVQMRIGTLEPLLDQPEARKLVADIREMVQQVSSSSRNLTRQLRPPALYEAGLVPALGWLCEEMRRLHGLDVAFTGGHTSVPLHEDIASLLFDSVRELLLNVVKHAGAKEAAIDARISEGMLRIRVSDEGSGFEAHVAERETSGLGLFSVRDRVAALGGEMTIDSVRGEGTTIELTVPLEAADEVTDEALGRLQADFGESPAAAPRQIRVLVVDDHAIVRQGISQLLQGKGEFVVVGEIGDGVDAISAVERLLPDIVLMDINLPRMNGLDATREIRQRYPDLPVIALTLHEEDDMRARMIDAGASGYVRKGGDADSLFRAIREACTAFER